MINEISVFFPAYNEEKNLETTVNKAITVLRSHFARWEVVIVDDGSTDGTAAAADRLARENPAVKVVTHPQNRGYGAAFRSGVYHCRLPWIAFTDADGQFNFAEITHFLKKQEETKADLVIGYYLKRAVPFYRKLNSFLWQLVVFLFFGLKVRDIDCGFKLFSKKVVETIPPLESERGAFVSTEFLVKAKKMGFRLVEIGVTHYPRRAGQATGAQLAVIIRSFLDLFRLWRKLRGK
jgi:glycosyltransferase involved in cell wall biosynthesis